MNLYSHVLGRTDRLRHLVHTTGPDGFPRAICEAPITLRDDRLVLACADCRAKAWAEMAVALETVGLTDVAVTVARRAGDASFETKRAMVDADWAPGELAEMYGR